ncbi:helicase, partial [Mycolicibacterium novocastrense]
GSRFVPVTCVLRLNRRLQNRRSGSTSTEQEQIRTTLYIRAFRWATDRIGDAGVVAFVSNGGWIDGNTADGMRLSLADDYSAIYVYNLRGNQRTAGELSRKEGGKVFGGGSRNTVAVFIGVKDASCTGPCEIFYRDIGDYLSREEKLRIVDNSNLDLLEWQTIKPNTHGDWVNQRDDSFSTWPVLGDKKKPGAGFFSNYAYALLSARDAWVYNFSRRELIKNIKTTIDFYNAEATKFHDLRTAGESVAAKDVIAYDPVKISWSSSLIPKLERGVRIKYSESRVTTAAYRPFCPQALYFDRDLVHRVGQLPAMFPPGRQGNIGFYTVGTGSDKMFSCMMTALIPDIAFWGSGSGQFFPRWTYKRIETRDGELDFAFVDSTDVDEYGYRRVDNITDEIHTLYRNAIGDVTKDDIFYYVYGQLHDPDYRQKYAADLKKMLPHIPTPQSRDRFDQLAAAGRELADLHVNYEAAEPYPIEVLLKPGVDPNDRETWRVQKMKWRSKTDHTAIIYNSRVTIEGIPEDAERYLLGSRSALGWIVDRYQVTTDKASGIVNDPNDWCDEHDDPTYIVDLIKKVTTVSVETMKIVASLDSVVGTPP